MTWTKRTTLIVAGSVGAGLLAWWWLGDDEEGGFLGDVRQIVRDAVGLVTKGKRLTHAPYDKTTGVVAIAPQDLADQTTYDEESYSLARCMESEEGSSDDFTKTCVGWAIKNLANHSGKSITQLLTHAVEPAHSGYYGTYKNIDPASATVGKPDRRASTAEDPYEGTAQLALAIQNGTLQDPTGGAIEFDRPAHEDADYTAKKRAAEGLVAIDLGIPGLRFWGYA